MICGHPKCAPACRGKSKDRLGKIAESDRLANNAAFVDSLEQSGTCQLYSPDRAAHIKWALCLDESRGLAAAAEDPYVRVRRLLPHQTRQEPGNTTDFHFHNIVHGFMTEVSNRATTRGAAPLDSETRKASRRRDRRHLIERGADDRKNDPSRNE